MSAKELRAWRKKMGFTQTHAAKFVGYSVRHYQRFEEDDATVPPPVVRIVALAKVPATR